jgi:hypothetical protein
MISARNIIVGLMFAVIAALLGYYGRKQTGCGTGGTACPAGQQCVNNVCVANATCSAASQCLTGQFCYEGKCQSASGTCAPACTAPQQCVNSVCRTVT